MNANIITQELDLIIDELMQLAPAFITSRTNKHMKDLKIERRFTTLVDELRMCLAALKKNVSTSHLRMLRSFEELTLTRSKYMLNKVLNELL